MRSGAFDPFAGLLAILAGVGWPLCAVAVLLVHSDGLSEALLLLCGLLATAPLVAIYGRLREVDAGFARWAVILGLAGALGAVLHGGYDLANAVHPPPPVLVLGGVLPASQVDPRGLLTFGVTGLAPLVMASLIRRGGRLPRGLACLGYLVGVLLALLYLASLVIVDRANPALFGLAAVCGFLASPAWYVWLGPALRRSPRT